MTTFTLSINAIESIATLHSATPPAKSGPALVHKKATHGSEPIAGFRAIVQPLNL